MACSAVGCGEQGFDYAGGPGRLAEVAGAEPTLEVELVSDPAFRSAPGGSCRSSTTQSMSPSWWVMAGAAPCGRGGSSATGCATGARARRRRGAAVITALYPAGTVLLARAFLAERIATTQLAGLGLAAVAVSLLAVG